MNKQPALTMRAAHLADIEPISDLCIQLGYETTSDLIATRLTALIDSHTHRIVVACDDDQVVGMIHGMIKPMVIVAPYVEINALVVNANHRSQGVGRMLLEHIEHWALEQDVHAVRLRSNIIREAAHRFYERLGYHITKTQYELHKELSS